MNKHANGKGERLDWPKPEFKYTGNLSKDCCEKSNMPKTEMERIVTAPENNRLNPKVKVCR